MDANRPRIMGSASQSTDWMVTPSQSGNGPRYVQGCSNPSEIKGLYAYAMPDSADHGPRGLVGAGTFLSSDSQLVHAPALPLGVRPYLR